MKLSKGILSGWVELSGLPKFTTTLIPFLLGAVLAWTDTDGCDFNVPVLIISLLVVLLLTEFCFVLNACAVYADLKQKGIDFHVEGTSTLHSTAVSGRFNALVKGKPSVKQAVTGAYACMLAALPLGVLLQFYFKTGILTLPLGILGAFIAYSYSRGLRLSYHGLGEIALTIGVGWLTVFSGYYVLAHQVSWLPTIVALPWTIDVFKLKLMRNIPDYDCDLSINRRNLTIRLGKNITARLYLPLTICSWLAFVPLLFLNVPCIGFLLLVIPIFFTAKGLKKFDLENEEELSATIRNAFTGMILIPVALIGIFVLKIVFF